MKLSGDRENQNLSLLSATISVKYLVYIYVYKKCPNNVWTATVCKDIFIRIGNRQSLEMTQNNSLSLKNVLSSQNNKLMFYFIL